MDIRDANDYEQQSITNEREGCELRIVVGARELRKERSDPSGFYKVKRVPGEGNIK